MYPNYYQPAAPQYMPIQPSLKGRPVSSLEEARVANVDFDGSLFIFPDVSNKKIYTKQINLDGTAVFKVYSQVENTPPTPAYVTKEEFDSAIQSLLSQIQQPKTVKEANNESNTSKPNATNTSTGFPF